MSAKYHFKVQTADQHMAGTDSNIFVVLYGDRNISEEIRINQYFTGNAFERNQLDEADIPVSVDCGDIYQIRIKSDGMYSGSEWLCSYISIRQIEENEKEVNRPTVKFSFGSNKWIKGNIETDIVATEGYPLDVPPHEEIWKEILGPCHNVPAGLEMTIQCETEVIVNVDCSKISVIENTTKLSVGVPLKAITATFETEIKSSVTNQVGESFGKTLRRSTSITIPKSNKQRTFQEIWQEKDYTFNAVVGEDTYKFEIPNDRVFAGLKELDKEIWNL